jgi:hypothetical protein
MILKLGSTGPEVEELCGLLRRAGYSLPCAALFAPELDRCVRAYQEDRGLAVDGEVVYKGGKTWPRLAAEPETHTTPDLSPRGARLSRGLATLYDADARRMRPEYRSSSVAAWEQMEEGKRLSYAVPRSSDQTHRHGATCGHAAWLLTSWWMRAMHPGKGIFPTWRTGRGPTSTMPKRFLPLAPVEGVRYGGGLHRGLAEYALDNHRVAELALLRNHDRKLRDWYICQRDSGHVICVLRIDEHFGCVDPRTGLPAVPGLYRLAADGSKATIKKPWTWRRVRPGETGPWTCHGMADLPDSGEVTWGPLAGSPDLPLVLE